MKSKSNYIADTAHHYMPHVGYDIDKAISYAERMYDRLIERGYGNKPVNHRTTEDHYGKLNTSQKMRFDKFWKLYGLAKSKQGAAMRWLQLERSGEIAKNEELIYQEARKEKENRGDNPAHAQRWLSERRYADGVLETKAAAVDTELRELMQDLAHFKRLDGEWAASEVARITGLIEQKRQKT